MVENDVIREGAGQTTLEAVAAQFAKSPELADLLRAANVILILMMRLEPTGEPVFGTVVRELYAELSQGKLPYPAYH